MSLLATASIWNEDVNKKRQPTMRKTQKKMPVLHENSETIEKDPDISSD